MQPNSNSTAQPGAPGAVDAASAPVAMGAAGGSAAMGGAAIVPGMVGAPAGNGALSSDGNVAISPGGNEVFSPEGKERFDFRDLVLLMERLRAPGGCPWDREQDHDSLKKYLIEETYEVLEAIALKDSAHLCEELGDLLLQIVFHASISGSFGIGDVITGICKKMVSRHPHVFGDATASSSAEVLVSWEAIKRGEKGVHDRATVLKKVPANLPALMRAYKVQQKAADANFDWADVAPVLDKVAEELGEAREALASGDTGAVSEEIGDLLFAVVNLSRFSKVHPELALTDATEKFIRRFGAMEALAARGGRTLEDLPPAEMDAYWESAKRVEGESGK